MINNEYKHTGIQWLINTNFNIDIDNVKKANIGDE